MPPKTPLSFIYHVTLHPAYRDELHHDIRQTFERFGITNEGFERYAQYPMDASAQAFQRAAFDLERAAFEIRGEDPDQGLESMANAAGELYRLLSPCLAYELAEGASGSRVQPEHRQWLLAGLFDTFYSTQRDVKPRVNSTLASGMAQQATTALNAAWEAVHSALQQPPGRAGFDQLLPHTNAICSVLATEYALRTGCWSECW